jgi:hypothetical protein
MELYRATCRYGRRRCEDQPVVLWVKVISQHYEQGTGVQLLPFSKSKDVPELALRREAQNGKSGLRQPSLV